MRAIKPIKKARQRFVEIFHHFLLGIGPASEDFSFDLTAFRVCQKERHALCLELLSIISALFVCVTNVMSRKFLCSTKGVA